MPTKQMTLERLPPVVQILLAESPSEADKRDPTKYIRRLLPELRRQAEWTMKHGDDYYLGTEERPDGLVIDPASGLDPFSTHGKCGEAACRLHNADLVARTVGLYADCAIVGDHFTDHVLLSERWSHYDNYLLFSNLLVLRRLKPMLEAGVFRFTSNFGAYCRRHSEEFKAKVKVAADEAVKLSASGLHLVVRADRVEVHTSEPLGSPLVFTAPMTKKLKKKVEKAHDLKKLTVELFAPVIYDEVHETLFKMRRATPFRAVTFSNSRVSLRAARHFDAESPSAAETEIWEASRSANLPWVSDLTPTQILELREGAHRALPRFRERMGRGLTGGSREEAAKVIRDLREEAAEVEAELRALDARGESRFRNLSGILGMTVSVYGFAGEFLAAGAALTGLGTLLGLLHAAGHKERQSLEKLVARPGYVLVKAKELTEHAPAP